MNKFAKFMTGISVLIAIAGMAIGMMAAFNPVGFRKWIEPVEAWMDSPQVITAIPFVMIGLFTVIFGFAFSPLITNAIQKSKRRARLKTVGQAGVAKIISVQDTGITINNSPYVKCILDINGTRAEISTTVSRIDLPAVGDQIKVVYDPSDPTIVLPEHQMN